jgi:hypothetical protein
MSKEVKVSSVESFLGVRDYAIGIPSSIAVDIVSVVADIVSVVVYGEHGERQHSHVIFRSDTMDGQSAVGFPRVRIVADGIHDFF